jgi:hypothetical protein
MAKRLFTALGQTFTAQAVSANLTNATYMALKGGSATQYIDVLEVLVSGKAVASIVAAMELTRIVTIDNVPTALASPNSDGPMNPFTAALGAVPVSFVAASTGPFVSNVTTDAKLNLALNLFGGIIRWNAAPTQQWSQYGNAADTGESVLFNSSSAGGSSGLADAHIMYEPM